LSFLSFLPFLGSSSSASLTSFLSFLPLSALGSSFFFGSFLSSSCARSDNTRASTRPTLRRETPRRMGTPPVNTSNSLPSNVAGGGGAYKRKMECAAPPGQVAPLDAVTRRPLQRIPGLKIGDVVSGPMHSSAWVFWCPQPSYARFQTGRYQLVYL